MEEYKIILDCPKYSVSNYGNIKNNKNSKILKPISNCNGYYKIILSNKGKIKQYKIHRLVALYFLDNPNKKLLVDHIDGNPLNNNVDNLRWATNSQNCWNSKLRNDNKSGIKGVYKIKNKWRATITCNKLMYYLGLFDKLEEAQKARIDKAIELFGEFINQSEQF